MEDAEEGDIVSVGDVDGEDPPTKQIRFSLDFNGGSAAPAAPPPLPAGGGGSTSDDMASGEGTGKTSPILNLAAQA